MVHQGLCLEMDAGRNRSGGKSGLCIVNDFSFALVVSSRGWERMVFGLSLCLSGRQARRCEARRQHTCMQLGRKESKGFTRKLLRVECEAAFVFVCSYFKLPAACCFCVCHVSGFGFLEERRNEVEWKSIRKERECCMCCRELWRCGVLIGGVLVFFFLLLREVLAWSCIYEEIRSPDRMDSFSPFQVFTVPVTFIRSLVCPILLLYTFNDQVVSITHCFRISQ